MQADRQDRSIGELLGDLSRQTGTLMRQEIELARTEVGQKVSKIGRDIAFLAIGGLIAYAGLLALGAALIIGLAKLGLDWWLAALIVGLVVIIIGAILVWSGLNALKRTNLAPEKTLDTLKDDVQWAKEQTQ